MLKKVLETLDLEPGRLQLSWISASEGKRYIEVVNQFSDKIKKLGPNTINQSSKI